MNRTRFGNRRSGGTFELQLTSLIDIFTIMVFFLLKGFAAVALGLVFLDAQIPQPVAEALAKDRSKIDRDVVLTVEIQSSKNIEIQVTADGKSNQRVIIPGRNDSFDLVKFHSEMVGVKQHFPEIFRVDVNPSEKISYKEIIQIMDQVRSRTSNDPKIFITDETTKKSVETNLLFPDVVFGNVMEG